MSFVFLALYRFLYAGEGVQAARVADPRNTAIHRLLKQLRVIADIEIARDVAHELGFAAALRVQETKGDQFPLRKRQPRAGVVIPKAMRRQPAVHGALLPEIAHTLAKDSDLRRRTLFPPRLRRGVVL